jgi:hypothetical protein
MRYRKLRITWSVFCLLFCALVVALAIRSQYWLDRPPFGSTQRWALVHGTFFWNKGVVPIYVYTGPTAPPYPIVHYGIDSYPTSIQCFVEDGGIRVRLWPVAAALLILAAAPWLPSRFSLRTMLIATTLIAVVLGLLVAVLRWPAG